MQSITLRPALLADGTALLQWKNDPVVRKFAIVTHDVIKEEDHWHWLRQHLHEIQIITDGIRLFGDIRIAGNEVAIKIASEHRGKGIAYEALKLVVRRGMIAKIVEGNIASMRLFLKCGFVPVAYKKGYYIFTYETHT